VRRSGIRSVPGLRNDILPRLSRNRARALEIATGGSSGKPDQATCRPGTSSLRRNATGTDGGRRLAVRARSARPDNLFDKLKTRDYSGWHSYSGLVGKGFVAWDQTGCLGVARHPRRAVKHGGRSGRDLGDRQGSYAIAVVVPFVRAFLLRLRRRLECKG
jgi:hypothetical protein